MATIMARDVENEVSAPQPAPDMHPPAWLMLPWERQMALRLPDAMRLTYEMILSLAWAHDRLTTPPYDLRVLARMRGLSPWSLGEHLRILRQRGLVQDVQGSSDAALRLMPIDLPLLATPVTADERDPMTRDETLRLLQHAIALLEQANTSAPDEAPDPTEPAYAPFSDPVTPVNGLTGQLAAPNEQPAPRDPEPTARCSVSWDRVLALLRERMGAEAVDLWLKRSRPLSCADGVLVIALASPYAVDWLESRSYAVVRDAIREVTGQPLRPRFVVGRRNVLPR